MKPMLKQTDLIDRYYGELLRAPVYKKRGIIWARFATPGETVVTILDEKETQRTAEVGDVVVKNIQSPYQEEYIISGGVLQDRYEFVSGNGEWGTYEASGEVFALCLNEDFSFVASWGEEMIFRPGDWLVMPTKGKLEMYRIHNEAFEETYREKVDPDVETRVNHGW